MKLRIDNRLLALLSALLMLPLMLAAHASANVQKGFVEVDGLAWTGGLVRVDLNTLGGGTNQNVDGEQVKMFTLLEILQKADTESPEVGLATLPKIEIAYPNGGSTSTLRYTGDQIRNSPGNNLARFFVGDEGWTNMLIPGQTEPVVFEERNPKIFDPTKVVTLAVDLTPSQVEIKTGQKVNFTAAVSNNDGKPVTYKWAFGDGTTKTTTSAKISHTFHGKDKQFIVTVEVTGQGFRAAQDYSSITIGKLPKKKNDKPKDDKPDKTPEAGNTDLGDNYGNGDPYGDTGTDYGTDNSYNGPSPSAPAPSQPRPDPEPEPVNPVDDGLTEITGELVSSTAPAATMTPEEAGVTETPPEPEPEPESSGFGIAKEAWTIMGLMLLFALGMLAERRGSRLG